jgi:hypothetical protein
LTLVARRSTRYWEQALAVDTREAALVESEDLDVVVGVFLDDTLGILVCVERVHQDEGDIDFVGLIKVLGRWISRAFGVNQISKSNLDLADREIKEGHALADLNSGFWRARHAHGRAKAAIELKDDQLRNVNRHK